MRAMILAAGRGERMRPLTDKTPKPLLKAGGKALVEWHLERLVAAGIVDIVINHAWLGEQIEQALGDGRKYGARIHYSAETEALETAGGIARVIELFRDEAFLVVNGDIWCDWDPAAADAIAAAMTPDTLAWLLLVDNPPQHPQGDFVLDVSGRVADKVQEPAIQALTFSGIGIYRPSLFKEVGQGERQGLAPLLRRAMSEGLVAGGRHSGEWVDVGTPARLRVLDEKLHLAQHERTR